VSIQPSPPSQQIEAYLDGALTPGERHAFERALQSDPALRAELDLQTRIDASLRTHFAGEPGAIAVSLKPVRSTTSRWAAIAAIAAAAAIALAGAGLWWASQNTSSRPSAPTPIAAPTPTLRTQYTREVARGFVPEAVCTTPDQFEEWVNKNYGQPLRPKETPDGVQFVGWSYAKLISPYSGVLLAKVNDQPVIVIMDKAENQTTPPAEGDGDQKVFSQKIGSLVLYEVTPLSEPRILPLLELAQR
jgi:anti-sigma factor RsiW